MIIRYRVARLLSWLLLSLAIPFSPCTEAQTKVNPNQIASGTICRLANVRYVDSTNICGWSGSDFGAWVNAAIADLPSVTVAGNPFKQGKIVLAPGGNLAITQSTTVTINSLFVTVEGPGQQELIISCTMNADCWQIRDSPWTNNRGSKISGFTLLGQGSGNANAVGLHVGDINNARFENISIDNFLGVNSSCMWWDNQNGWSERNIMLGLEVGAHTASAGEIENGCTKLLRFTTSVNANAPSFGYNEWYGIRMGLKVSGQIGWSLEATNPFNLYSNTITGNANMVAGTTLFSVTGGQGAGEGNWIFIRAESTGAATGWSTAASSTFGYMGPGIVENTKDGANIADSLAANTLYTSVSPTNRRSFAFGIFTPNNLTVTTHFIPNIGAANNFLTGIGFNMWWDGANWRTKGDSVHNGGSAIMGSSALGSFPLSLYVCPDIAGTDQSIANGSLNSTCLRGPLTSTIGSGTSTSNGTAIANGVSQAQPAITVSGALVTDVAVCSLNAAPVATWQTGIQLLPAVVTANTVTPWLSNPTAGSITPAAAAIRCTVIR